MNPVVHYLINHPTKGRSLIYPTEIDSAAYVGFGGFYLLGNSESELGESFKFHAIFEQQVVETKLIKYRNTNRFYRAEVDKVGSFLFYAQPLRSPTEYAGSAIQGDALVAMYRLRSWNRNELDEACTNHNFYFIGYSPRVNN